MHYCKNENPALLNTIDNAVRETVYKTAPDVFFYDQPHSWVIDNVLDGSKHLDGKIVTQARLTIFVVFNSFVKFVFCFGMK